MTRPLLLDLFCGAGGAATGYDRAGFDVTGVDNRPQPRYPFEFVQADALEFLAALGALDPLAAIHASPVCKLFSAATPAWARARHPNQIAPARELLLRQHRPWVIENVPGAPLRPDLKLCGCMVGLHELERERWFETSWHAMELRPPCHHATSPITVAGHGEPSGPRLARGQVARKADWERVMGIGWMTRDELSQAIPPAYTEHVGRQLLDVLNRTQEGRPEDADRPVSTATYTFTREQLARILASLDTHGRRMTARVMADAIIQAWASEAADAKQAATEGRP